MSLPFASGSQIFFEVILKLFHLFPVAPGMKQDPTSPVQFKTPSPGLLIAIALTFGCLVLSPAPNVFGVVPPPDGGYPGFNTAEGQNALFSRTTGSANTAVGWNSLFSNTEGSFNTATGAGTLLFNTADNNTAIGGAALLFNTTGFSNVAVGVAALLSNTEGAGNTAIGYRALASNTIGGTNTATGSGALENNIDGDHNTAAGLQALFSNSTGDFNTANGDSALFNNTTGMVNTALGVAAGINVTTASHVICIGSQGADVSNSCFIGNIRGVITAQNNAVPVLIDSAGQLGTMSSSRRYKKEIKPMGKTSDAILALKPVTFHYKSDSIGIPQFGLIAEEVAEVNPDLVVRDEKGEIYTVRYEAVNAMLLNEFLKAHRRIEDQDKRIDQLTAQLKEQALLIQNVNDKVELNGKAPQTAANHQ
jgi:hypothetical protein